MRARGNEFGAVTGRPRRCGWLDLVVLRYAKMLNGIDSLVVTKLDVFDAQPEIKVCTGYRYKGKPMSEMPPDVETLAQIEPEYRTLPGWRKPTPGIREVRELPIAARDYLNFISDELEIEIGMISTGPERDATIVPRGTQTRLLALAGHDLLRNGARQGDRGCHRACDRRPPATPKRSISAPNPPRALGRILTRRHSGRPQLSAVQPLDP